MIKGEMRREMVEGGRRRRRREEGHKRGIKRRSRREKGREAEGAATAAGRRKDGPRLLPSRGERGEGLHDRARRPCVRGAASLLFTSGRRRGRGRRVHRHPDCRPDRPLKCRRGFSTNRYEMLGYHEGSASRTLAEQSFKRLGKMELFNASLIPLMPLYAYSARGNIVPHVISLSVINLCLCFGGGEHSTHFQNQDSKSIKNIFCIYSL